MSLAGPDTRAYVRAIARRYVRDVDDVEDVVQDALLRAHQYRDTFKGDAAYRTWIYRVAVTAGIDYVRRRKRAPEPAEIEVDRLHAPACTHGRAIARVELARIEIVVEKLGPRLEAVFWQSVRDGMSEGEIARAHGLTVPAVKARIHRAKKAVVAAFQEAA